MSRFTNPSSGGGSSELPQGLATNSSPSFDKIYLTHNSDGTNVYVGDDAIIGDIDQANNISIRGQQDATQGGIFLGDGNTAYIQGGAQDLNIGANQTVTISADASPGWINLTAYEGAYVNGINDPLNKIATKRDLQTAPQYFAYGSFYDMNTFGPYTAWTDHAFSLESTALSNDVHIGGINNDQIVMDRDGKFNIAFSAQFHVTSGGAIVYIWLRKNGTNEAWTNTRYDITANNPYAVPAWNFFVDAAAGDYYEIMWASSSSNVKIEAITGLTGGRPSVPSMIVTVNQVG